MNEALQTIHNRLMTIARKQPSIGGAWYFGSASRAMADEYSDLDVVFLVDSADFEAIAAHMTSWLEACLLRPGYPLLPGRLQRRGHRQQRLPA